MHQTNKIPQALGPFNQTKPGLVFFNLGTTLLKTKLPNPSRVSKQTVVCQAQGHAHGAIGCGHPCCCCQ